ncbi:MAG: MBL fold metallo-hydrolase [Hyphomonadaceae bacterium]
MSAPAVRSFFHEGTATWTHVAYDPGAKRAAIVDPVLDYNPVNGAWSTKSADALLAFLREEGLTLDYLLETHIHADHLSAAPYLKDEAGGVIGIGAGVASVQETWNKRFNLAGVSAATPAHFDRQFTDNEPLPLGGIEGRVLSTPGHTANDVTYVFGDAAFVGDTFFNADYGVARTDFPGGDAPTLYRSLQKIMALPANTHLFLCHDYLAGDRKERVAVTSLTDQRANVMFGGLGEAAFVEMRRARDKELTPPVLLFPSVQVNIRAGELPPAEDNGAAFLKIPLRKA